MNASAFLSITTAANETPDRLALIGPNRRWTYAELARAVHAVRPALVAAGVDFATAAEPAAMPGRVLMVAPNTVETIIALLALFEAGVPVMLMHPRSTPTERDALAAAYPPAVRLQGPPPLSSDTARPLSAGATPPESAAATSPVRSEGPIAVNGTSATPSLPDIPADIPDARDLAVFFTSGTTGRPKAVRLSRGAFMASAIASAENLTWQPGDRWQLAIPLAHVGGLSIVTRCLIGRRTVVLAESNDPTDLRRQAEAEQVTLMSLVPTQLRRWLPRKPPPSVRAVLLGGAPAGPSLRTRARQAGWPLLATYGLTEACSQVTVQRYGRPVSDDEDSGRPLAGTTVTIRDGRILVRGPTLLSGYLPSATGPTAGPAFDDEGWFDTGDLGHLGADGRLYVHARRQDLILSGGENVYPREVEDALTERPDIGEAVVFGVDDADWGQAVAAAVTPAGTDLDVAALDSAMRARLAGYKRPRWWAVVDRFAVTPSGKIDRRAVIATVRPVLRRA